MGVKEKNIQFIVELPDGYTPRVRQAIAQEIIDHVIDRTQKGVSASGRDFKKYSKTYEKSLDFKIAGKKKGQIPDLTLSSDMLNSMRYLKKKSDDNTLVIGYGLDDSNAGKVEGNQIGSYGQPKANPKHARPFLGITEKELNKILDKYPLDEIEEAKNRAKKILSV